MTVHNAFRTTPSVKVGVVLGVALLGTFGLLNYGCSVGAVGPDDEASAIGEQPKAVQALAGAGGGLIADPSARQKQAVSENGKATGSPINLGNATNALERARILRDQGQYELATYYYLNAINGDPKNARILLEYGELVEKLVAAKEKEGKRSEAAELALRELAAINALLPPGLANEVTELARQLNEAAVEASKRQAKESSQKAWEGFLKEKSIESRIAAIKNWKPPYEVAEDGACTRKLEEVEVLMREIQAVIPLLSDFETREKAMDLLEELSKEAERISKARQNRYCRWALEHIRSALQMYERNKGWLNDNEVAFGDALINELGPIDESLLTFETRRCYSEAFETIFGELGKVRSTDFQTKGTKMYVLKGMLEKEKKTYRDF